MNSNREIDVNYTPPSIRTRNASIDLLRLVCTFSILIHHFFSHGLNLSKGIDYIIDAGLKASGFVFDTFLVGMTLVFVLISGYLGVHLRFKNVFTLLGTCFFYSLCGAVLYFMCESAPSTKEILYMVFRPFSHTSNWFIPVYIWLLCVSPLLNITIAHMDKKTFATVLGVLLFMNLYFGFLWNMDIGNHGCSLANFVLIYMIGRYLRLHVDLTNVRRVRCIAIGMFLGGKIIPIIAQKLYHLGLLHSWVYNRTGAPYLNNPFFLIAGVGLLVFFLTFHFQSKFISYLGTSAVAVYLVTENSYISHFVYDIIPNLTALTDCVFAKYLLLIVFGIICMVACLFIDKMRLLLMNPIMNPIQQWADQKGWNKVF